MSRTVLIVDDNAIERSILIEYLKSDYQIIEAENGKEALEVLHKSFRKISAVIMDIVMPVMDGFDALKAIKTNAVLLPIPVIITTGLDDDASRERAIVNGADSFITKPYNRTLLLHIVQNAVKLREIAAIANSVWRDTLTGLLNRDSFFSEAERMIKRRESGYYVLSCFNVENFKVINDQYGTETGDKVLKHIASCLNGFVAEMNGLSCRYTADKFAILYPAAMKNSEEIKLNHKQTTSPECIVGYIRICIGRYIVNDLSIPVSTMFDRASMAEESIKGKYDEYIADYTDSMRERILSEQKIVNSMTDALANGEFEPWFQPQYNHATGAIIGAEALVRWRKDGKLVSPAEFIPVFERNGFIYEMDKSIWEQVCRLMRKWLDEGRKPLPVSVNISRRDVLHKHFVEVIKGFVDKYNLPYELIRLEVTESAFAAAGKQVIEKVGKLIELGFTVEIDDFGSGYSSLNTLKDVPAEILKLDMKFFENTKNKERSGNIVESIVRMAKWLGMAVIAEGVEEKAQADYLKTIGCYYIQGYFYSKPVPVDEYEKLLDKSAGETRLSRLETLKTLDNNEFWNPMSMETLIFNSYVGGACIFEYNDGKVELLRVNDEYLSALGGLVPDGTPLKDCSLIRFLSERDKKRLLAFIRNARDKNTETVCEGCLADGEHTEHVRATIRQIAHAGERYLFYCVVVNTTKQRRAEHEVRNTSERIAAVMNSSHCGITAVEIRDDGNVNYLFVNNRFYEILGYTKEQFNAEVTNPFGCIHPDDYERTVKKAMEIKKPGQNVTLEMRAIRRDKRVVWLRNDISIVKFANVAGTVQLSNFLDITEQVESERKQLESARQLEIIMSNVNGGVSAIRVNDDGTSHFVFNNEKYYSLYGYTREQAAGIDVMTTIVPEDLPTVMEKVKKLKADKQPTLIDYRITRPDGKQALLRANASIMSVDGYGDDVITSVVTDITEKRSLEEQLRAIITNINGGVSATYLRDGKPEYVIVNNQYYNIIGYTKEQFEAEVSSVFDLVVPEDRAKVIAQYETTHQSRDGYSMEYGIRCRNGQIKRILCNTNVIRLFGTDEPIQLAVSNDITELREAQRKEHALALQLQTIMANISGGITASVYNNGDIKLIFSNDGFYEMYGYTRESAAAEMPHILDIILEADKERIMETLARIVRERGTETYEYRCRRRDGSIIWIKCANTVISLDGVGDTVLLAVTTDITAEKAASEQLHFLNNSAHDILAQRDTEIAINKTLENMLMYFSGDRAYVIEIDSENRVTNNTYEKCADGVESEMKLLQGVPFGVSEYWFAILSKKEFVVITDVCGLGDDRAELRELLLRQNIHSIIIAPLYRDGVLIGFTGIDNPTEAVDQLERLQAVTDYIAILLTRRDLERKIAHDNNAIKQLINDTPGGFLRMELRTDGTSVINSINDGLCKMLGMTHDEVMREYGGDAYKCLYEEDFSAGSAEFKAAAASCGQFTSKCRLRCKDGTLLWVMVFGRFTKDEAGKLFLNSYFTDITAQKEAEDRQRELLDNLPCGAGLYQYDGQNMSVVYVNRRYREMVGRDIKCGQAPTLLDAVHPDDLKRIMRLVHSRSAGNVENEVEEPCDVRIRHADGTYHPYQLDSRMLSRGNGKWSSCVTFLPISEGKLSMRQMMPYIFPAMMKSSTDITFVKDTDYRYLCCSRACAKLFGFESEADVVGKTDYELFPMETAGIIHAEDCKLVSDDIPIIDKLETFPCKNGMPYHTQISKYLLRDTTNNVLGIYGIGRDITEPRETSNKLNLITDSLPGGLATFIYSTDGNRLEYFNDGFCSLLGYTRENFNLSLAELLNFVFGEDKAGVCERTARLIRDNVPIDWVYRIHTKDGGYKYISHKAVIAERFEESVVVNSFFMDITEAQEEKERLRISEEMNRLAIGHSGNIITRFDVAERTLALPDTLPKIYVLPSVLSNMPEEQIELGRVSEDTASVYRDMFESIIGGKAAGTATYKQNSTMGWRWLEAQYTTVFSSSGAPVSAVISFTDITERLEKEIVYSKWQQSLNERSDESYTLFRCNLNKNSSYDSWEGKLLNVTFDSSKNTFDERTAEYVEQCVYDEDRAKYLAFVNANTMLAEYYRGHRTDVLEYREMNADGEIRWLRLNVDLVECPNSKDVEVFLMYENIDEKKKTEILTTKRSETDPLTGVLNRAAFAARTDRVLSSSQAGDKHALLLLDIDDFKQVNDTYGHAAGDQLLIDLTKQIGASLRHYDLLGRLGGDEFFILMKDIPNKQAAEGKASRICNQQICVGGSDMTVTVSIGVAMIPENGRDFDTLYKKADDALYLQKSHGKNGFTCAEK